MKAERIFQQQIGYSELQGVKSIRNGKHVAKY